MKYWLPTRKWMKNAAHHNDSDKLILDHGMSFSRLSLILEKGKLQIGS